ncbi:MAG: hypothetical protein KDM81_19050, partial [Verrucomicrobiae bacterium]|nr:hypothetical protein [Verrucomicrobiae bacterium]
SARAAVTVSVESVGAAPGERAVVRVFLDQAIRIAGGTFVLHLPEFVTPGPAVTTSDTAGFLIASHAEAGRLAVSLARSTGLPAGPTVAFSFSIRVSADAPQGNHALAWERSELFSDGLELAANVTSDGRLVVLAPPADTDADGLPDPWENRFFRGLGSGPDEDFDADGASNRAELLAGTDPSSAESVFRVGRFEAGGTDGAPRVAIEWEGDPDRSYEVFWSDGPLGSGNVWHPVYRPVFEINGSVFRWTDDGTRTRTPPLRNRERYYRISGDRP